MIYTAMGDAKPWPVWILQAGIAVAGVSVLVVGGLRLVLRRRVPRAWWAAVFGLLLTSVALSGAAFWLLTNSADKVR